MYRCIFKRRTIGSLRERPLPRQQVKQHGAERIHIAASDRRFTHNLLGCGVLQSQTAPCQQGEIRRGFILHCIIKRRCNAKVE